MADKTLGQLADEGTPLSEAFDLVRQLAEKRGWIPIGFRRIDLPDSFIVTVNGTPEPRPDHEGLVVSPYYASVHRLGWPVGIFGMFDGTMAAGMEDRLIESLKQEIARDA